MTPHDQHVIYLMLTQPSPAVLVVCGRDRRVRDVRVGMDSGAEETMSDTDMPDYRRLIEPFNGYPYSCHDCKKWLLLESYEEVAAAKKIKGICEACFDKLVLKSAIEESPT